MSLSLILAKKVTLYQYSNPNPNTSWQTQEIIYDDAHYRHLADNLFHIFKFKTLRNKKTEKWRNFDLSFVFFFCDFSKYLFSWKWKRRVLNQRSRSTRQDGGSSLLVSIKTIFGKPDRWFNLSFFNLENIFNLKSWPFAWSSINSSVNTKKHGQ